VASSDQVEDFDPDPPKHQDPLLPEYHDPAKNDNVWQPEPHCGALGDGDSHINGLHPGVFQSLEWHNQTFDPNGDLYQHSHMEIELERLATCDNAILS
jgi:hypothetical protein